MNRPLPAQPIELAPGVVLGGPRPLICLSLVSIAEVAPLLPEIAALPTAERPDVVEWRLDSSPTAHDGWTLTAALRAAMPFPLPLIVTSRLKDEGGRAVDDAARAQLLVAAAKAGVVVDIEYESIWRNQIVEATPADQPMIISWHELRGNPSLTAQRDMIRAITAWQARVGRPKVIVKFAVQPRIPAHNVILLNAVDYARHNFAGPVIGIGMGLRGQHTRYVAPLYGSDMTFATHPRFSVPSAPGQPTIADVRAVWRIWRLD